MKKSLLFLLLLLSSPIIGQEDNRIRNIKNNLELLAVDNPGLSENLKLDINVNSVSISNFLLAVSQVHKVNIDIDPNLQGITIVNNFSNVTVSDLLVFLCKQYNLDIDFTGNILSIQKFQPPPEIVPEKQILVSFDALNSLISLDLKADPLEKAFRKIMDVSGQNLLFNSGMETIPLTLYIKDVPIDMAMEKLAETNNLKYSKSRDGFYLFDKFMENNSPNSRVSGSTYLGNDNFQYQVLDTVNRILNVDFTNVPIADIVHELSLDLDLDVYMATPLAESGNISFKAKQIYYDELLTKMFESKAKFSNPIADPSNGQLAGQSQNRNQNRAIPNIGAGSNTPNFTFKKENDLYFFGTADQLSVRKFEIVQMMYRSVELLGDPMQSGGFGRSAGRTVQAGINFLGNNGFQGGASGFGNNQGGFGQNANPTTRRINTQPAQFNNYSSNAEAIVNILPDDVIADLDIKIDFELNSFLISGPAANINRFKKFVKEIDKPVPVVLIEVMLIEVRKTATVETGISWGIGEEPVVTSGGIFPEADLTLGAKTVNKIIGGFDGFGSFNIGRVVPEFFATIKAMEANGNLKIRSTPKLSTLNGHRANLSIGETTYYVVTSQNFFGSQIPTTSEVRNFQPIDAQLAVSIKPLVSGNGQVTLDINVIQSDFSSERIDEDAPPGLTSREFSSIIRMQNQDLAILGGLEEKVKNDSGNGVPFLARIPVIKWLFSKRRREDTKQKLTILIKPTVIY